MNKKQRLRSSVNFGSYRAAKQAAAEALETRVLLSVATASPSLAQQQITQLAQTHFSQPLYELVTPSGSVSPLATSPVGLTPAQMRGAYGVGQFGSSTITFGAAQGDGTGQTIAIVDAYDDPNALSDLNTFSTTFSLPTFNAGVGSPIFSKVNENGQTSPLPGTDPAGPNGTTNPLSWEVEESLDIEWAHVMAPNANIILVECNSASDFDLVNEGAATAATLPGVSVVSMSFGGSEFAGESGMDPFFTTPAGSSGVTFLAATGDTGSPGEYPAYSQNVVAVGGTSLNVSGNSYVSETGWSGSGGGISEDEFQPSFQTPSFTSTQRTIPDVSMDANPNTGVAVYDSYDVPASPWLQIGGTSLSTPMWAGLMAVVNQGRVANSLSTLNGAGQTLPLLYKLPSSDFNDVTSGSNGGFSAGSGYDLVTGLGSPMANLVVPALASATAPALLPDLQPYQPPGWSAPLLLSTAVGSTTDPAMIFPGTNVYLAAAWFNDGTTVTLSSFDTDISLGGVDLEAPTTAAGLQPGQSDSVLPTVDNDLGAMPAGTYDLSYSIDINSTVPESTETNNTYNRTYVVDGTANDHYTLKLDSTGKYVEIMENGGLAEPAELLSTVNGILFYLSGANDTLTIDASNGNPIPYGQVIADGAAASNTMTVNGASGNNTLTINQSQLTLNGQTVNYSGLGSITINTGSGNDKLTQTAAPTAAVTFSAGGGSNTLVVDAGAVAIPAAVSSYAPQTFALISIASGGSVIFDASTTPNRTLLQVASLKDLGTLNLNNNDMIVQGTGESGYGTINGEVATGRGANGLWAGTGITSSSAAAVAAGASKNTALAVVLNDTNQTPTGSLSGTKIFTTFDGQTVNDGDVLVKYTYYGDALLTGSVTAADYLQIDDGFNTGTLTGWYNGDFNYDGAVNGDDYSLIDNAYNSQNGVSLAASPANQIAATTSDGKAAPITTSFAAANFSTVAIVVSQNNDWTVSAPPPMADDLLDSAAGDVLR